MVVVVRVGGKEGKGERWGEDAYLAIGDFPKALEDLLRRILIFSHGDHESDKLLKCDMSPPARDVPERFFHLLFIVDEAETRQCGAEFEFLKGVGEIAIEVTEH